MSSVFGIDVGTAGTAVSTEGKGVQAETTKEQKMDEQPPVIDDGDEELRFRIWMVMPMAVGRQPTPSANDAVVQLIGVEEYSGEKINLLERAHSEGQQIAEAWNSKNVKTIKRSAAIIKVILELPLPKSSFSIQMFVDCGAIGVCVAMVQDSGETKETKAMALDLLRTIFQRGCTVEQASVVQSMLVDFLRTHIHDEASSDNFTVVCETLTNLASSDDGVVRDSLLAMPGLTDIVRAGLVDNALKNTCRVALADLSAQLLAPPFRDLEPVRPIIVACNHCVLKEGE
ncbi:MAG TPA: hypothetical protein VEF04_08040, partial [Blastocatellia bacterium]|nr:hypothetical protein [Blastocatellia bacterium]